MESDIAKDLGADSLDIVEMLMSVETNWGITIEDEDVQTFKTVGDVVALIQKLKK
jgi:acyl carrier protein